MSRTRVLPFAVLSLTLLIGFAVCAASLDSQSLWRDEVDALRFASAPWPELRASFTRMGFNGPLYHLFLRGWVGLTGTSEYALRFSSLWFGVLCVALVYALGHRLFNRPAGLIAALLAAGSPYLVWYSQEVKMYTLVPALALAAVYGLRRAVLGHGWHWWVLHVVATSLAFYSHILAALLIPVQALLLLVWWRQARRHWVGGLISLACLTLPYLPLLVWQWQLVVQARETGFMRYPLGRMALVLLGAWSAGMAGFDSRQAALLRGLTAGLAVWGLLSAIGLPRLTHSGKGLARDALPNCLALLIWIALPAVVVAIVSTWQPIFTDRYLIWSAPAFYLLIGVGLAALLRVRGWGSWAMGLLLGVLLVFDSVAIWQQANVPNKSNFRAAAAYVAGERPALIAGPHPHRLYLPLILCQPAPADLGPELVLFQIPYARYTFDYYFPAEEYAWAEGPYTNRRSAEGAYTMSAEIAAQYMLTTTAPFRSVWLVLTEADMWDDRGLTFGWLEANGRRVDEAHFMRVDVYRYRLGQSY